MGTRGLTASSRPPIMCLLRCISRSLWPLIKRALVGVTHEVASRHLEKQHAIVTWSFENTMVGSFCHGSPRRRSWLVGGLTEEQGQGNNSRELNSDRQNRGFLLSSRLGHRGQSSAVPQHAVVVCVGWSVHSLLRLCGRQLVAKVYFRGGLGSDTTVREETLGVVPTGEKHSAELGHSVFKIWSPEPSPIPSLTRSS